MTSSTIDLNADCGESLSAWAMDGDEAVLAVVTSANVACGFHAGDPTVARRTCTVAAEQGVVVGAQVSYDDLKGFGRRFIAVPRAELTDQLVYQTGALQALARASGTEVSYVKPHGALYNAIVHHEEHAGAVVDAVRDVDDTLPLLVLPGSEIERQARAAGLRTVREAFADRGYTPQATLVPRTEAGAVLHDAEQIAARADAPGRTRFTVDVDGRRVRIGTPDALAAALSPAPAGAASPAVAEPADDGAVTAHFAGTLVSWLVSEQDTVEAGQDVAVLEAMKTETRVSSPRAGTVRELAVSSGDAVAADQVLARLS